MRNLMLASVRRSRGTAPRAAAALTLVATLSFAAGAAHAAGFAINEWNARGLGMANAHAAMANTPAAVIFNPAGLVQLRGLSFQASVMVIAPQFAYNATPVPGQPGVTAEVEADRKFFPVPSLFAAYRLHDRVAVGFGVYTRFGLGLEWPTSVNVNGQSLPWWARSQIQEVELQTVSFAPTVAVKLHERILVGGGFAITKAAAYLTRSVTLTRDPADDINVELSGSDVGFNANAGLLIKAIPGLLNVGFTYRGGISLELEGNASFSKAGGIPDGLRASLVDGPGTVPLDLPHQFAFSLAAFPVKGLSLGFALEVTTWSSYPELRSEFENVPGAPNRADQLTTVEKRDWRNSITIRVGGEYRLMKSLLVRLGLVYDQTPAPSNTIGAELPDAARWVVSVGGSYEIGKLSIDAGYAILWTGQNETADTAPLPGTYNATAHLFGLGLGYQFDI